MQDRRKGRVLQILGIAILLSLASHDVSLLDGADSESALEGPADSVASLWLAG